MNPHFSILGLTFYWYGLIIGVAIALVLMLVDQRAAQYDRLDFSEKKHQLKSRKLSLQLFFQQWSVVVLICGFVGARLWHVATDWQLYQTHWQEIVSLSRGGLSIIGAIVGGLICLLILRRFSSSARAIPLVLITDTIVFGLPFGQAIGRLGNWINQELYGLPSNLPWAITIDSQHRLAGYELIARYHPLFMYEAIGMLTVGITIWLIDRRRAHLFGTGFYTLLYLTSYCILRFALDFLRLDRPVLLLGLGVNQVVMLVTLGCLIAIWMRLLRRGHFKRYSKVQTK